MEIELLRANIGDAKEIHAMQVEAFKELLEKYQDFETNPGNNWGLSQSKGWFVTSPYSHYHSSKLSSAATHICKFPSRWSLVYSSGSSCSVFASVGTEQMSAGSTFHFGSH